MVVYVPALEERDPKAVIRTVQQLAAGRSNAVGTVTLAVSAATTTVTDMNCSAGSVPLLVPATADAATEDGAGTRYIPAATITNGAFVIHHANSAVADRTYLYALLG